MDDKTRPIAEILGGLLVRAAFNGDVEASRRLVAEGADVNMRTLGSDGRRGKGRRPLHCAVTTSLEITRLLLDNGAEVNAVANGADTPLLDLAGKSFREHAVAVLELLVERGARIDQRDELGGTAMHIASGQRNATGFVERLAALGADIDAKDDAGMTPLHHAAGSHNPETVRLLLSLGADVNAADKNGDRPIHCLEIWQQGWQKQGNRQVADLLIAAGNDPRATGHDRMDLLARSGNDPQVAVMITAHDARAAVANARQRHARA